MNHIYGDLEVYLPQVAQLLAGKIQAYSENAQKESGYKLFEHLLWRVKSAESMCEKCRRKQIPETPESALRIVQDAVGIRVVTLFIDDVFENVRQIRALENCTVVTEKDYVNNAKPNGYRSYHMILDVQTLFPDVEGNTPGHYFAEIQLRTIAMDTWAALEHEMKYKHDITNTDLIERELKRCAGELAACDVSMQTIRDMIMMDL